jgi:hypothetical protein
MNITEHWRPTTTLRTGLVWLLSADIVTTVAFGFALNHQQTVVDHYNHGAASYSSTQSASSLLGMVAIAYLVLLLATAAVFIVWQWRSAKNNEVLGRIRPRYTPGWSIGGWFIPLANLVIPVRIMQDLWQGSDPEIRNYRDPRSLPKWSLIGWWWGCTIGARFLAATIIGQGLIIVSGVLAIVMVRRITDRQEAVRFSGVRNEAGWYTDPTARFDHRYWDGMRWTDHVSKSGQVANDPIVEIG